MKGALIFFGGIFSLAAIGYEAGAFLPATENFFVHLPFVSNSVVKVSALAMLCFLAARDFRKNLSLAGIVIAAHVISIAVMLGLLLGADTSYTVQIANNILSIKSVLWSAIALDGGITFILLILYHLAWNGRFQPAFFLPTAYRSLMALAEVVVHGEDEKLPPEKIAQTVDKSLAKIRAKRRWVHRLALTSLQLHPLLYCKAPFSELDTDTRLAHLKKHFRREVLLPNFPEWWRQLVQAMIRVAKQLCYVGYYSDPAVDESIGYVRFEERARFRNSPIPRPARHPLEVDTPEHISGSVIETDICIIGSGAAGSILAYQLLERTKAKGSKVLIVERGDYIEPRHFSDNEVEMMGKLYADGLFQQTADFRFTVLQGSCVGGSTVVNNAVCFDPPKRIIEEWNNRYKAGLDPFNLGRSVGAVRQFLHIQPQPENILNPSHPKFAEQIGILGLNNGKFPEEQRVQVGVVDANIEGCVGCGYCNIGCKYGKKMSMLDKTLPEAQRRFPGRLRIMAECEVEHIRTASGEPQKVIDIRARLSDGRRVTIKADTFVVSAGAIASSYLLQKSGIGRDLPVGNQVCFNMGSPITAEFNQEIDAYDGLQISHYGLPAQNRGFVMETWWNPPVAQAVNMPGWFEEHYQNMKNYRKQMAVGVLVGTENNGKVRPALTGGPDIDFVPTQHDLSRLADGLVQAGEVLFAAGARRVMINTWGYDEFTHPNQLFKIYELAGDPRYIALGSGHPQGGNAISEDPTRGVVGPDFRVHGYQNLYVCDASVFPSSITVNPQLTIMSLADYAARIMEV